MLMILYAGILKKIVLIFAYGKPSLALFFLISEKQIIELISFKN